MSGRLACLGFCVAWLVLAAPSLSAHGNQMLCARVSVGEDGRIELELTADHTDNPNIADAQEARVVLREALNVYIGTECFPLERLGALQFEERDRYSDDAPVSSIADPGPHRLVVARWRARLPDQDLVFAAKERTPLDVVMWRAGAVPPLGGSRWLLLIAGERSPTFTMTPAARAWPGGSLAAVTLLLLVPLVVWGGLRAGRGNGSNGGGS